MNFMKNPKWNRDELILALDLYFKLPASQISSTNDEIIKLSKILNQLSSSDKQKEETFRNPNGVSMKLNNFKRLDPDAPGSGLVRGGKLEKVIWEEFSANRSMLEVVASKIRQAVKVGAFAAVGETSEEDELFPEGKVLFRLHRYRERNCKVVKALKKKAMEKNELRCSICSFDFYQTYGELGRGFIECHHTVPISDYQFEGSKTNMSDLILVCSNCHRMLHRKRPWINKNEIRNILTI